MLDSQQLRRWAQIMVDHSTRLQPGEVAMIYAYHDLAKPLLLALYREVLRKDPREVIVSVDLEEVQELLIREAPAEFLARTPELELHITEQTDVWFGLRAHANTRHLTTVPDGRMAAWYKMRRPIIDERVEHTRWVLTEYPTAARAQEADMSLEEWEAYVFGAIDQDWKAFGEKQAALVDRFNQGREVRIVGEETDLTLSVEGRTFISGRGDYNMPDGEFFTGPVESSAQGQIAYTYPAIFLGHEVDGVRLTFEEGRVVEASAEKNEGFLLEMLNTDEGARYLGELGIGNNFQIDRFVKNTLFDEKIGGSVHLALGKSFLETGGKNESAIHWDMIKDLREGGEIYLDGELIQKDGKWLQ